MPSCGIRHRACRRVRHVRRPHDYNLALNLPVGGEIVTIDAGIVHDPSNVEGKTYRVVRSRRVLSRRTARRALPHPVHTGGFASSRLVRFVWSRGSRHRRRRSCARCMCQRHGPRPEAVSPGGVIVWDDYTPYWPGVKETLDALARLVPLTHYPRLGLVMYADRRPGRAGADPAAAARALRSHAAHSAEGRIRGG